MQSLKTFKMGGIHPPHEKLSAKAPIIFGEVPEQLIVAVDQHIGKPCQVLVKKGDVVKRGDKLAQSTGFVSSNIHAPVNGKVLNVLRFPQLGGQIRESVIITPEVPGENLQEIIARENAQEVKIEQLTADEIRHKISEAGVVGMGGAGFPTHVKLTPPADKKIDALIINGAECEPYITSDHRVMLERTQEIVKGVRILQQVFGGVPVYIGIEENKADAISAMQNATSAFSNITVIKLKAKYPQGGEKQLIKAILNREVPSKGLPMDVGVIVQNAATVLAIHDAIYFNRPLTERVVTVSGNLVKTPGNILLPIGAPVSYLLKKFDIEADKVRLMISGGPMMGKTSYSFESPIYKTTSALLFFDESVFVDRRENPCIRCGSCIRVCPMGLAAGAHTEMIRVGKIAAEAKTHILDCIECGSCSYACPADRRLVQWMRLGKNLIRREN